MTAISSTGVFSAKELSFNVVPQAYEDAAALVMTGKNCRQGGIACIAITGGNAGYYQPGATAVGLFAMGRFEVSFDNTTGVNGAADATGKLGAKVRSGAFQYNSGTGVDAITQATVGQMAWIIDDQTVGATDGGGTRSPAGPILAIDPLSSLPYIGIGPAFAGAGAAVGAGALKVQVVRGITLVAGTAPVGGVAGTFSLTATSVIVPVIKTIGAGTQGTHYECVGRVTGAPGTAAFTVNAVSTAGSSVLVNTDVNVLDFFIVG